jgi:FMN phosphatase YigB (HAD superfamily)
MPVLAFDFDGVLCNSVDECMQTTLGALSAMEGKGMNSLRRFEEATPSFKDAFRKWRHLVRPAKEYDALYRAISHGDAIESHFNLFKQDECRLSEFETEFFRFRNEWRLSNPEDWFGMHSEYPNFQDSWSALHALGEMRIVTNKDLASVMAFNERWQLNLEDDWIWSKERQSSKAEAVLGIANELEISASEVHFIDDDPKYLEEVSETGAATYWASWGYAPAHSLRQPNGSRKASSLGDFCLKVNQSQGHDVK